MTNDRYTTEQARAIIAGEAYALLGVAADLIGEDVTE